MSLPVKLLVSELLAIATTIAEKTIKDESNPLPSSQSHGSANSLLELPQGL